jgi:hypothetical protein
LDALGYVAAYPSWAEKVYGCIGFFWHVFRLLGFMVLRIRVPLHFGHVLFLAFGLRMV